MCIRDRSDAYESKSEDLDLELKIRFVNINPGYNEEMIEEVRHYINM